VILRAIGTSPYLYLTKPFRNVDLLTTVEIAIRYAAAQSVANAAHMLVVKDGDYYIKVFVENIDYIESDGNYLLLTVNNKRYKYRSTIKQFMDSFPDHTFIQTHRAFIINRNKIEKFKSNALIVSNQKIPVSKNYFDRIMM
jgi:DNA-binding LytR/AlgR family response regulator